MVTCSGAGDPCSEIDCCSDSGLVCIEGYCAFPEPTCVADGYQCDFVTVAFAGDGSNCCGDSSCLEGICIPNCIGETGSCKSSDECCDGYYCSDKYTCDPIPPCGEVKSYCKDDYDCCAGLYCSDKGICVASTDLCGVPGDACEMVEDHGCCGGLTCFEGVCDNPSGLCMDKWEYCDGKNFLCCKGLICGSDYFCHPEKKDDDGGGGAKPETPAAPTGGAAVTTLPSTGSGSGPDGSSWVNAAAIGGAAAVLGGAMLRKKQAEAQTEES
jgi:hypothetical protein